MGAIGYTCLVNFVHPRKLKRSARTYLPYLTWSVYVHEINIVWNQVCTIFSVWLVTFSLVGPYPNSSHLYLNLDFNRIPESIEQSRNVQTNKTSDISFFRGPILINDPIHWSTSTPSFWVEYRMAVGMILSLLKLITNLYGRKWQHIIGQTIYDHVSW